MDRASMTMVLFSLHNLVVDYLSCMVINMFMNFHILRQLVFHELEQLVFHELEQDKLWSSKVVRDWE